MTKTRAVTIGQERICVECGQRKPLTNFYVVRKTPKEYRGGRCNVCQTRKCNQNRWSADSALALKLEKQKIVNEIKKRPCVDCGVVYPPYVMDFDHVRGEKRGGVAKMVGQTWSVQALMEEIEKCDLVCANCHRVRTFGDGGVKHKERVMAGHAKKREERVVKSSI